jgi:hypothetical protein
MTDISVLVNGTIDITWYVVVGVSAIIGILTSIIIAQYHYYNYVRK